MNKFIFSTLIILVFCCCGSKEFENEEQLWLYIKNPDNGYLQEKSVNGVDFSLLYKPTDLLVAQEIRNKDATPKEIDSLRNKYGQYVYFNLTMSSKERDLLSLMKNQNKFGRLVNQLSFDMDKKVNLISNKEDTIPLLDYSYPRMYGTTRNTSMIFIYDLNDYWNNKNLRFAIDDIGLRTGEVNFRFEIDKIIEQPTIY